jgi:hypothetical protein
MADEQPKPTMSEKAGRLVDDVAGAVKDAKVIGKAKLDNASSYLFGEQSGEIAKKAIGPDEWMANAPAKMKGAVQSVKDKTRPQDDMEARGAALLEEMDKLNGGGGLREALQEWLDERAELNMREQWYAWKEEEPPVRRDSSGNRDPEDPREYTEAYQNWKAREPRYVKKVSGDDDDSEQEDITRLQNQHGELKPRDWLSDTNYDRSPADYVLKREAEAEHAKNPRHVMRFEELGETPTSYGVHDRLKAKSKTFAETAFPNDEEE